jgi:hypothetical protein
VSAVVPADVQVIESDPEVEVLESTSNVETEPPKKKLKPAPQEFTAAEHASWVEKHRDIIYSLPRELFPTSYRHGEYCWTTWVCT